MIRSFALLTLLGISQISFAGDRPGGIMNTAVNNVAGTYEVLLSPSQTISPAGAYMSTEFRYQASEDAGLTAAFGAGEIGLHFGGSATWYIAPDVSGQPAFALTGGLFYSRLQKDVSFLKDDFIVVKVTPTVSKGYNPKWGRVTPYAGLPISPSFGLGGTTTQFSLKTATGVQVQLNSMKDFKLTGEFGVGLINSFHEIALGVAYSFDS